MRRFDELTEAERDERLERVARKALLAYGLEGDLRRVASSTHTVFLLRTGGASFAVRACAPGRDRPLVERELTWLAALGRDTRLSVPEPLLTRSGDLFRGVSLEGVPGTRACMVLRWVDGERREAELSPGEVAAAGRFAAALHAHAEAFRWPEEVAAPYAPPDRRIDDAVERLHGLLVAPDDRARLESLAAALRCAFLGLGDGASDVGAIHGDLRFRKLRYADDAVGAFGFDECRRGAYLDDVSALWAELSGREAEDELRAALLEGYGAVRALPPVGAAVFDAFSRLRDLEALLVSLPPQRARAADPAASAAAAAFVRRHA